MPRQRNYKAEYQRRKELRAQRGQQRDYALEYERRNIRSQGRGFLSYSDERRYRTQAAKSTTALAPEAYQKQRALHHFGISERKFNDVRRENKAWSRTNLSSQWTQINTYDERLDMEVHNWSINRVGYILAYHGAIVNPNTNYDSLKNNPKFYKRGPFARKLGNAEQYFYLVKYARIMQADEFEARYGRAAILAAYAQGEVKP
jgi:hypothetical protein